MKQTMRQFIGVVIGLCLALAGGPAAGQTATTPDGLWGEATVYRDTYGTPHIHASSLRGLAFAFGYAQAEDHLETILMAYRVALGTAAAVGGEAFAEGDAFALKIANAEVSRAALAEADLETRDLCHGFAMGINAWIFEHQDTVPPWVEGVQPMDVLAFWHFLMVTSAPFDLPGVFHPEPPLKRANAWALAPQNTIDGNAMLVMSPFQYYRAPYQWYEAHLMLGNMNWAGATLLGLPILLMGHNARLGWALTPNEADIADMFREDMESAPARSPNDPTLATPVDDTAPLLRFMASAKPYYIRTGGGLIERGVPSLVGSRGPILEGADGALYSWRNGAFGQFGGMRQLLRMAQAADLAAFQDALLLHQLPCFQVLYADGAGNIFYVYNARAGNRNAVPAVDARTSIRWNEPLAPNFDVLAWRDLVPPGRLPHIVNPAAGFLQACGTPPWLAAPNSGLSPADWPRWLVPEDASYRAHRVAQILSAGRYGLRDMEAMLFDTLVPAAADMVPMILGMARSRPELVRTAHPDLLTGLNLLGSWNLTADRENEALAYYARWWALIKRRYQTEFPSEAALYRALLQNSPAAQESVLEAATDAARAMRNEFNRLAVRWGDMHRLQRGNRDEPMYGADAGDPIFYTGSTNLSLGRGPATFGYGFAMAVEFRETPRARSVVPFGASGRPESPHFNDQMTLFLDRRMKWTHFAYDDVVRQAVKGYGRHVVLGAPDLEGYCAFTTEQAGAIALESMRYPPRPYPNGLVPFTPTVRPVLAAGEPEVSWELEWSVPDAICKLESRPRLRFHTYTREEGWVPLLRQRYDGERDVFTGSGSGAVIMALMGPPAALETAVADGEPDTPTEPAAVGGTVETDGAPGAFVVPAGEVDGTPGMALALPEDDVAPTREAPPEAEKPDALSPPRPLFDLEILGGSPGAPGDGPEWGPDGMEPEEEKKGLRGFLKKLRERD